jgi:hypothetical protein
MEIFKVWPGVLDAVPEVFKSFATEPAFSKEDTTFCIGGALRTLNGTLAKSPFPRRTL